ncbi:unnamed protein product [Nesidiocoris tenuis]|uniref:Uncharacterized protein n=1 Tax=Nesidiocoris tenuis TaxID=355587 RepID=A0A6H5GBT1_9HEMI|nr:unnamed protein product [Nesidiocoris tenuis]
MQSQNSLSNSPIEFSKFGAHFTNFALRHFSNSGPNSPPGSGREAGRAVGAADRVYTAGRSSSSVAVARFRAARWFPSGGRVMRRWRDPLSVGSSARESPRVTSASSPPLPFHSL